MRKQRIVTYLYYTRLGKQVNKKPALCGIEHIVANKIELVWEWALIPFLVYRRIK